MEVIGVSLCIEVTEAVSLFLSLLHARMRHAEVDISWNIMHTESSEAQATCTVEAQGLGAYYLDGVLFLQTLYTSAPNFQRYIQNQVWPSSIPPVQLVSRRIGDHTSMTCYSVGGLHTSNKLIIKETVQSNSLPTTSLLITVSVNGRWKEIEAEMTRLSQHLHLLHIINPEVCYKLKVASEQREHPVVHTEYKAEVFRSLLKTPFKLATSLHHYLQPQALPIRGGKLRLIKGETAALPCCVTLNDSSLPVDFQVSCAAALVPHSAVRGGRKLAADQYCTHVHVYLFGPCKLPLLPAHSSLPPSLLADWGQYRLLLQPEKDSTNAGVLLVPGLQFKVTSPRQNRHANHNKVLQLFVFFEEMCAGRSYVTGENKHWSYHMALLRAVRNNLTTLLSVHSTKLWKAVHSVLDKLICNYAVYAQLRSRVERVVPSIAEAVSSIVQHSTSQQLKRNCRDLLQLKEDNADDMIENVLAHKLSELAKAKLDLGPEDCSYISTSQPEEGGDVQGDEEGSDAEWSNVQGDEEGSDAEWSNVQGDEEGSDAEWSNVQGDDAEWSNMIYEQRDQGDGQQGGSNACVEGNDDQGDKDTRESDEEWTDLSYQQGDGVDEGSVNTDFKDLESMDYDVLTEGDRKVLPGQEANLPGGSHRANLGQEQDRETAISTVGMAYNSLEKLTEQTISEEDFLWDSVI